MNYYNKHAKEYIDNTKDVDMKDYYDIFESYIDSNAKFCNDTTGNYRARLVGDSEKKLAPTGPTFKCGGITLTSGYGLLTADEAVFAGAAPYKYNTVSGEGEEATATVNVNTTSDTYITLSMPSETLTYWTMTRYSSTSNHLVAMITGNLSDDNVDVQGILRNLSNYTSAKNVVPVINLKANVTVGINGEGTFDNPYVVQ